MRYPNLLYAIAHWGRPHYQLAAGVPMHETRFSRSINGRLEFAPHEKERIAEILGYPVEWLFAQLIPPPRKAVVKESPDSAHAAGAKAVRS